MDRLFRHAVAHPWRTLALAAVAVAAMAPGLVRLELRTDGAALVPAGDPAVQADRRVRRRFGVPDTLVVLVDAGQPGGLWQPAPLALVAEVTGRLAQLPGVGPEGVSSLATERGDRYRPGTLDWMPLLEPVPRTEADVRRVRDEVAAVGLYEGTLVALDGSAAAILVDVPRGADRPALYRRAAQIAETAGRDWPGGRIEVLGAPAAEALLGERILADLGLGVAGGAKPDAGGHPGAGRGPPRPALGAGLMPLAVLVMALLFVVVFRSPAMAAIPLVEVGGCLVLVFGAVGWVGLPVTLPLTVLPVILVSMGVADEVHILWRHRDRLLHPDAAAPVGRGEVVAGTMAQMRRPVVTTSVTTAVALLSFLASPIEPVRQFGIVGACGVLCTMAWSLAVTPALLVLLPGRLLLGRRRAAASRSPAWERLAAAVCRRPWRALGPAALVLALVPLGARHVVVQDSWIDGFAPDDPLVQATRGFERRFFGAHVLLLEIDAGREVLAGEIAGRLVGHHELTLPPGAGDPRRLTDAWLQLERPAGGVGDGPGRLRADRWSASIESARREPGAMVLATPRRDGSPRFGMRPEPDEVLRWRIDVRGMESPGMLGAIDGLQRAIAGRRQDGVGGVLGPPEFVAATEYLVSRRREGSRRIPDDPERVRWLWQQQRRVRGADRAGRVVDPEGRAGLVTVLLRDPNYRHVSRLLDAIDAEAAGRLRSLGVSVTPAGDVARSQALIRAVVSTQLRSLALSLLGVLLVAAALGRSLRAGLYAVLPCAASVAVLFAVMGLAGVPLGVATSMFAGIVLGLGVDSAVHLVERVRRARAEGRTTEQAIAEALRVAGPAVVIDALVVSSGFAVLSLSSVPANARLGALVALCLATSLTVTLLVLPALMRLAPPRPAARVAASRGPAGHP